MDFDFTLNERRGEIADQSIIIRNAFTPRVKDREDPYFKNRHVLVYVKKTIKPVYSPISKFLR